MKKNQVEIKELRITQVMVPIREKSPLIIHKWNQKAKLEMEEKQQGKSKTEKHKIRVPEEEFEGAKYVSPLGFEGFPAGGFKKALIRGAKMTGLVMKDAKESFFVIPDCIEKNLVKITYEKCSMGSDMVRVGMGSADIRYRPYYYRWSANLRIEFNEGLISVDQIFQMVAAAGWGCGIGDWRPSSNGGGEFGRFEIAI